MYDCHLDVVMHPCYIIFRNFSFNVLSFLYSGRKRKSQPHSQSETCFIEDADLFSLKKCIICTHVSNSVASGDWHSHFYHSFLYSLAVLIQCGPAPSDYLCIPEASAKWGSFTLLKHLSFALLQQLYLSLRKKEGPTWLMECSMQVRSQKWCEKYSRHFLALTFSGCLVGLMLQRVVMVKWMQNETTQSTTSWTVYREQSKQKNQGRAA